MQLDPAMLQRVRRPEDYVAPELTPLDTPVPWYRELRPHERILKRAADIVFSVVALAIFALLLPILALAIKLDSQGSVFYSQQRVGLNRRSDDRRRRNASSSAGERRDPSRMGDRRKIVAEGLPFPILKLRTMYVNSESEGIRWAQPGDARITRVGRFLRQTRLDEVPQFWNVLCGDMSVVGPRPERAPFVSHLSTEVPGYLRRLQFKPGITGLAQVKVGYDAGLDTVHEKVAHDLEYMQKFSLWLDLEILFRSVWVVIAGKGV